MYFRLLAMIATTAATTTIGTMIPSKVTCHPSSRRSVTPGLGACNAVRTGQEAHPNAVPLKG